MCEDLRETAFGPLICTLPKGHGGRHADDNGVYAIRWVDDELPRFRTV